MSRIPMSIAAHLDNNGSGARPLFVVLADDGTMWCFRERDNEWSKIPSLPSDQGAAPMKPPPVLGTAHGEARFKTVEEAYNAGVVDERRMCEAIANSAANLQGFRARIEGNDYALERAKEAGNIADAIRERGGVSAQPERDSYGATTERGTESEDAL